METLLSLAVKYGPELVVSVVAALKKNNITIAEAEEVFKNVKPYSSFGIDESKAK
jgi:hypothetical protein